MTATNPTDRERRRPAARANGRVALLLAGLTAGMLGSAFAAVPFYTWFCRTTGYSGTPGVAAIAPDRVVDRVFEVRFDANVHAGLPWDFRPEVASVKVRPGEVATVVYRIENRSDRETRGTATFNVTPDQAGGHFDKLACFCFGEQTLKPGEVVEAPVTFYVDPDVDRDKNMNGLGTITLSYTFFAVDGSAPRAAALVEPSTIARN
jgi:cytochrome c oxidase assembly protein subunit 11